MIESRITEMNREMPVGNDAVVAASRQVPNASEPVQQKTQATRSDRANAGNQSGLVSFQKPIDVKTAVEKLNKLVQSQRKDVHFSVDEESQSTVIKFFKTETGELIKQFPAEEILSMIARIRKQVGWLHDSRA
jgi:flagellar protein FlaG